MVTAFQLAFAFHKTLLLKLK